MVQKHRRRTTSAGSPVLPSSAAAAASSTQPPAAAAAGSASSGNVSSVPGFMRAVECGNWDRIVDLFRRGLTTHLNAANQKIVLRKAVANKDVRYRSLFVFRRLLDVHFPMNYVDSALAEAIQNSDWDLVPEICSFSPKTDDRPTFPDSLPMSTKIRMAELLQPFPEVRCYLDKTVTSLAECYVTGCERLSDDEVKKCAVFFMENIHEPSLRGVALVSLLLLDDGLDDIKNHLKTLSPERVMGTATDMFGWLMTVAQISAGPVVQKAISFLRFLRGSGLLTPALALKMESITKQ